MAETTPNAPAPDKASTAPKSNATSPGSAAPGSGATAAASTGKPKTGKAAAGKGAKKTVRLKKPMWTVRLEQRWRSVRDQVVEALRGLRSPDRPTRRMALFFTASLLGLVVVGLATIRYVWIRENLTSAMKAESEEGKNLGVFLQKQADEAHAKSTSQSLGTFTVELKPVPDSRPAPGVMNLAEVEIVVQCDSRETCMYVSDHLAQAKNQVTGVFTAIDREELLSREGKKRLRRKLLEALNNWLHDGQIQELFFSKLIVS